MSMQPPHLQEGMSKRCKRVERCCNQFMTYPLTVRFSRMLLGRQAASGRLCLFRGYIFAHNCLYMAFYVDILKHVYYKLSILICLSIDVKLSYLLERLYQRDEAEQWLFRVSEMVALTGEEGAQLYLTLHRARQAHIVVELARGWLYFPRARSLPPTPLDQFALEVRRPCITYASLEAELSRNGWIPQVPTVETYMTTGREARFDTPLGSLELVHTKRTGVLNTADIQWIPARGIWVATSERALRDLHRVGRNLNLVEHP